MAYDRARQVTVLAGGEYNNTERRDVWEWNGASWTERSGAARLPEARDGHAMVYDSARDRIVLYGGTATLPAGLQTLEYDGSTWEVHDSAFPINVQRNHAMAFDSERERTVLIPSGTGGGAIQVYEWDGIDWTPRGFAGALPGRRENPVLAFDEVRRVTVLMGGEGNSGTWTYDGTVWVQAVGAGPGGRDEHAMAYDAVARTILLYSGLRGPCRCGPARDLWAWDGSAWAAIWAPTSFNPLFRPSMAYDEARQRTVLYGGLRINPQGFTNVPPLDSTWEWDGAEWSPISSTTSPGGIYRAPLVYDPDRQRSILYGGTSGTNAATVVNTTWEFDGQNWTQGPDGPPARSRHAAAYDRERNRLVVFGGADGTGALLGDTWTYNGTIWAELPASGPSARENAVMAFDPERSVTVLFGGHDGDLLNDTWEWDGSQWTEITIPAANRPATRQHPGFAFDPQAGAIIMYGGDGALSGRAVRNDVWRYNGQWIRLENPDPIAKAYTGFAVDTVRGRYVLTGGVSVDEINYTTGQTWEASIGCYANCDGSTGVPVLNVGDFVCFQQKFAATDPYANCDGSTQIPVLNVGDFVCFQQRFAAGCP